MKKIDLYKLKSLEELIYATAKITTNSGEVFEGEISSYTRADDTDDGLETVGIDMGDHLESFDITMIKEITIKTDEVKYADMPTLRYAT